MTVSLSFYGGSKVTSKYSFQLFLDKFPWAVITKYNFSLTKNCRQLLPTVITVANCFPTVHVIHVIILIRRDLGCYNQTNLILKLF